MVPIKYCCVPSVGSVGIFPISNPRSFFSSGSKVDRRSGGADAISLLPKRQRLRNLAAGALCTGFAFGTYFWIIMRMKGHDPLKEVEEEAQVNLHKSGLKVTYKSTEDAETQGMSNISIQAKDKNVSMETNKVPSPENSKLEESSSSPAKLGWKKYILFGSRNGQ